MVDDFVGVIPYGWQGGKAVTKWWRGKFLHLYRLHKPCAQCGVEITIDVTKAAANGTAKNAGMHLVRCPACRQSTPKENTSRPVVLQAAAAAPAAFTDADELEQLRMANAVMKEELAGLYGEVKSLRAGAWGSSVSPKACAPPATPLTLEQSTANLRAAARKAKMPWDA